LILDGIEFMDETIPVEMGVEEVELSAVLFPLSEDPLGNET